jgi:hypothetical protein
VESYPSLAIDRQTGRLYLAWPIMAGNHTQIAFTTSSDDGHRWSVPVILDSDSVRDFFLPTLAVSPAGVVALSAYGRLGATYRVYLALSTSCGRRFTPALPVDDISSSLLQGGPPFLGDFAGLAIDRQMVHPAWTDSRRLVPVIYTRTLPIPTADHC